MTGSECFASESCADLVERARGLGHDDISWSDEFSLNEQRAIDMMNGTKWYTLLFLLNYYDVDLGQCLADIELSGSDWIEGDGND